LEKIFPSKNEFNIHFLGIIEKYLLYILNFLSIDFHGSIVCKIKSKNRVEETIQLLQHIFDLEKYVILKISTNHLVSNLIFFIKYRTQHKTKFKVNSANKLGNQVKI